MLAQDGQLARARRAFETAIALAEPEESVVARGEARRPRPQPGVASCHPPSIRRPALHTQTRRPYADPPSIRRPAVHTQRGAAGARQLMSARRARMHAQECLEPLLGNAATATARSRAGDHSRAAGAARRCGDEPSGGS
eukprot:2157052-Prymnesium_polylepis.1